VWVPLPNKVPTTPNPSHHVVVACTYSHHFHHARSPCTRIQVNSRPPKTLSNSPWYGFIDARMQSGFGVKFPTPTTEEDERMG